VDHMSHSQPHAAAHPGGQDDPPGPHGMAIIGEQAVYLSHLPMFMVPHDWQVLLEVELEGRANPQEVYFEDRKAHPQQRLYTFDPIPFVLPQLFPDGEQPARLDSFDGTLYRAHFERDATDPEAIAEGVTARVRNVIYRHRFQADEELDELRYLLFGRGSELFLAHLITRPPDFDHLLSVSLAEQPFSDEELAKGIVVKLGDRPNTIPARISPEADKELPAVAEVDGRDQPVELRPEVEYYFETGDLRR
jgi:hypothetical protein